MLKINRVIVIVLDSVGVGWLPDAADFGDEGANTLVHIAEHMKGLNLPHMKRLGLGNITTIQGVTPVSSPQAAYGKMIEASGSKDTMAGHWEIMGLIVDKLGLENIAVQSPAEEEQIWTDLEVYPAFTELAATMDQDIYDLILDLRPTYSDYDPIIKDILDQAGVPY